MFTYLAIILLGTVAGLRSMVAPAVLSWGAYLGWINLENSGFGFMGYSYTVYIFTAAAIGELIMDKLPATPSRKATLPFAGRILMGGFCGAVLGSTAGMTVGGAAAGIIGAFLGTMGGYEFRTRLAKAAGGKDLPAALLEDVIAIGVAFLVVAKLA